MIITKTPFRVSFAGGGTDLHSFFKEHDTHGCVVSCSIDKYIYQLMKKNFFDGSIIKYSKEERVASSSEIKHKIIKYVFDKYDINNIEYHSIADFPSGLGLGSSSAFTVGLLRLIKEYQGLEIDNYDLAYEASDIEINQMKEPIGMQDQFGCAIGGIKKITFHPDNKVIVNQIELKSNQIEILKNNLILFRVGDSRSASKILKTQSEETKYNKDTFTNLLKMRDLAEDLSREIKIDVDSVGHFLNINWGLKRTLTEEISTNQIDEIYETGIQNGALGGKLLGAGKGGFMLFYCEKKYQEKLCQKFYKLQSFKISIDEFGASSEDNLR